MNENQNQKFLVVGNDADKRNLVAAFFRKHGKVFVSKQSVPDFIQWAKQDSQTVLMGFDLILVVVQSESQAVLKGLDEIYEMGLGTFFQCITEEKILQATADFNSDILCDFV